MEKETKICPFCGKEILAVAKKCKYCKKFLNENDNVSSDSDAVQVENKKTPNNTNINTIVGAIVVLFIVFVLFSNSGDSLLSGCEFEKENYSLSGTTKTYYCKNNLYSVVNVYTPDGTNYSNYSFSIDNNMKIASYYRKNGEYYCSIYSNKDDISPCDEATMMKLIKSNAEKIKDEIDSDNAKQNILGYVNLFREYNSDLTFDFNRDLNTVTCNDIFDKIRRGSSNYSDIKGCQIQFKNGVIMSLSNDGQFATIYDSDSPKYYINLKRIFEGRMNGANVVFDGKQILADSYIKDYSKAKQLSKKEVNNINPKLHYYP